MDAIIGDHYPSPTRCLPNTEANDNKAKADDPMDEILKDADVIHHSLGDPTKEVKSHEHARYAKLCAELGWPDGPKNFDTAR